MEKTPSSEERVWAVISHLSALIMGMGLLLPVIGWSESRNKSTYASYHSLQALGYQSLGYTVWLILLVLFLFIVGIIEANTITNFNGLEDEFLKFIFTHIIIMFFAVGIYFVFPIIGAIACAFGRNFHYPVMGRRLARFLGYGESEAEGPPVTSKVNEDRWVAAMSQFTVIIPFWGLLAPITAWVLEGKRSQFLKFHTIQAIIFQSIALVLPMLSFGLYFVGMVVFVMLSGVQNMNNSDSGFGVFFLIFIFVFLIVILMIAIVVPLLHILGQWAGYRILVGGEYRYPVIGKWLEKRMLTGEAKSLE